MFQDLEITASETSAAPWTQWKKMKFSLWCSRHYIKKTNKKIMPVSISFGETDCKIPVNSRIVIREALADKRKSRKGDRRDGGEDGGVMEVRKTFMMNERKTWLTLKKGWAGGSMKAYEREAASSWGGAVEVMRVGKQWVRGEERTGRSMRCSSR